MKISYSLFIIQFQNFSRYLFFCSVKTSVSFFGRVTYLIFLCRRPASFMYRCTELRLKRAASGDRWFNACIMVVMLRLQSNPYLLEYSLMNSTAFSEWLTLRFPPPLS